MLCVLSPAKSLDFESPLATRKHSQPELLEQSAQLVEVMATKSPDEIAELMSISDKLAELNFDRYQNWEHPFTPDNARAALLAFDGDVYAGMDAPDTFNERDYTHAQKTVRILSGLYGVLRPLDLIQPYRLEMGTKLANSAGQNLYDFWQTAVTDNLNTALAASPGTSALVNLASNEYFRSVNVSDIDGSIISPVFLDATAGKDLKVISFFAKKARGAMASWLVQNRVKSVSKLEEFSRLGYQFDADRSTKTEPVFTRLSE